MRFRRGWGLLIFKATVELRMGVATGQMERPGSYLLSVTQLFFLSNHSPDGFKPLLNFHSFEKVLFDTFASILVFFHEREDLGRFLLLHVY